MVKALVEFGAQVFFVAHTPQEKALLAVRLHQVVRKLAHAFNYFVLGCLAYHAFRAAGVKTARRLVLTPAGFCICFAVLDEWHQLYVPGRSPLLVDVLLDSVSAIMAILICSWVRRKQEQ